MPLNDRVGEIFLANRPAPERAAFSNSLKRFLVPDRGTDREELEVVLLVESPHTTEIFPPEINDRYPLAGDTANSAGLIVRHKLAECRPSLDLPPESIGSLVHQEHNTVQQLGIMNASQLPFQRGAYQFGIICHRERDCRDHDNWDNYIGCMKTILGGYWRDRRNCPNCRHLDDAIAVDLRLRLDCLHIRKPNVKLICCGGVAREFYRKAINRLPVCSINRLSPCNLSHPTNRGRGGELWEDLDCEDECLGRIFAALGP